MARRSSFVVTAARGTSDWHGLIVGGRALDHPSRLGLGFRPGPNGHVLDTMGIITPRCEDLSRTRRDRAYTLSLQQSPVWMILLVVSLEIREAAVSL